MKRRWTIRQLLLGVNLSILLVPLGALAFLQVFDAYLLRQTERQLIAESVVIGEAWRDRLLDELGLAHAAPPPFRPAARQRERFTPFQPRIDLGYDVLSPATSPSARDELSQDRPARRAGAAIEPLLARAQVFNLSGARVLDERGCVVASSGADGGECLAHLAEVGEALGGRYAAVVRRRLSDDPAPPLNSIRRRSKLRVFTALPVFLDGRVIGVVRMSRTTVSPVEMLWAHRGKVAVVAGVVLLFTPVLSYLFSHAISKPVRMLTREADAVSGGRPRHGFQPGPMAPREVAVLSQALDRMTSQLTERSEYITQFAANVSHELKTPLTGISGAVELLREDWERMPPEQRQRFLRHVAEDARRMERLVAGLLRLARIEAATEPTEEVELGPFFSQLARRYAGVVDVRLDGAPRSIVINRDQLEAAVHNLVDNAVRHGAGRPVEVRVGVRDARTLIAVRDRGPGISQTNRSRVFERFFTTERDSGGTGLGLSIVRAVAHARGGDVAFDTGPDGTTFHLVL